MLHQIELSDPNYSRQTKVYQEALHEYRNPYPSVLLHRWPNWNRMTGGFRAREFTILCGSTGAGKTTILANISAQLLTQKKKHFVMSVETGHTDFMKRILSCLTGEDLNTGDAVSIERLKAVHQQFSESLETDTVDFSLYENRIPVEQLIHEIRYMKEKRGCEIVMIDNLNFFLDVTTAANQYIEMDRVTHELIIFCKQIDVHIIMVMHPNKSGSDKSTRVNNEYGIKGSATAVQEAHNIWLFNRPNEEDIKSGLRFKSDRELTIAKMRRRGQYVGKTLIFGSHGTRYTELGIK